MDPNPLRSVVCLLAVLGMLVVAGCGGESGSAGGGFCDSHRCIASFSSGTGSVVLCADGMWSHSGGRPGACSHHGGVGEGAAVSKTASGSDMRSEPSPASAAPSPAVAATERSDSTPSEASLRGSARKFVEEFYAALDLGDYGAAWKRLPPATKAQAGSFAAWQRGYGQTISNEAADVSATLNAERRATVTLKLRATDLDACADEVRQRFAISWALTRNAGRWTAASILSTKVSGRSPTADAGECDGPLDEGLPGLPDDPDTALGFCQTHECIENFDKGAGSIARCADGMYSHSGGRQGACSGHGGLAGGPSSSLPRSGSTPSYGTTEPSTGGTVHVDGYYRKDGTYVRPYTRRAPCSYC